MAHRFFKERRITHKNSQAQFADSMQQRHQLMQVIIEEIKRYSSMVSDKVREEARAAETANRVFDDSKLHEKVYASVFEH